MSGTRRSRKQPDLKKKKRKTSQLRGKYGKDVVEAPWKAAATIANSSTAARIAKLFGGSMSNAKKALLAMGPAAASAAAKFSPKMKPNKKTTAQKRADLVRKAEREGIKLRTYKPKKKKGPR